MEIRFLGAANTVTGSQFLLTTGRARILVDCGMFQGSPHEVVRNRVPLAYDPASLDAVVLTHAHLDHCGLIPHLVAEGFRGPIYATAGTIELAGLVLLDSGKLQEEFAKRQHRWAARHPDKAQAEEQRDETQLVAQEQLAAQEEAASAAPGGQAPAGAATPTAEDLTVRDEQGVGTRMGLPPFGHPDHAAAMAGSPAHPNLVMEEPVYDQDQAQACLSSFRPVEYESPLQVAPGIAATFHDAGHILGSAIVELHVDADAGTRARTLVFSGDLGRVGAPILRDPTVLRQADYVLVESTYGGRTHEPEEQSLDQLAQAVNDVVAQKGVLLVPSFAIGRTQEMVWALERLLDAGRIPTLKVFVDSPMASKATTFYREHTDYYDPETLALLARGESPIDFPGEQETPQPAQSESIERSPRPYILIAANGMLTGGRVVNHVRTLIGDPTAVILFVGYQGEGTLGANLQAGATSARIDGQTYAVRCAVRSINGFSAHADEPGLLAWLGNFISGRRAGDPGVPRRVFIVHGDPEAQQAIEPKIAALGLPTLVPHWHQRVVLD
jgi:metallo-beta-lactamase family protein